MRVKQRERERERARAQKQCSDVPRWLEATKKKGSGMAHTTEQYGRTTYDKGGSNRTQRSSKRDRKGNSGGLAQGGLRHATVW